MANMTIEEVEGIGPAYGEKLRQASIQSTDALLLAAATRKGRKDLAEQTGISEKQVLKWANMADLFRIRGVGPEFAELLEAAGVDTVKELRHRNAENLAAAMDEVNGERKLTRRVPNSQQVGGWIEEAKALPAVLEY